MRIVRNVSSLLSLAVLLPALCLAQGAAPSDDVAKLREQMRPSRDNSTNSARRSMPAEGARCPAEAAGPPGGRAKRPGGRSSAGRTRRADVDTTGRPISPLAFHIGGADFTPGGFMDFATAWRSTNIGSGVATSFAGVPMSNTAAGRIQEFRSSAANSRVTLTITEHPTVNTTVTGYLEGDFYGNQPTSLFVTSNANTFACAISGRARPKENGKCWAARPGPSSRRTAWASPPPVRAMSSLPSARIPTI